MKEKKKEKKVQYGIHTPRNGDHETTDFVQLDLQTHCNSKLLPINMASPQRVPAIRAVHIQYTVYSIQLVILLL